MTLASVTTNSNDPLRTPTRALDTDGSVVERNTAPVDALTETEGHRYLDAHIDGKIGSDDRTAARPRSPIRDTLMRRTFGESFFSV